MKVEHISSLILILLRSHYQHGLTVVKILKNLVVLGIKDDTLSKSFDQIKGLQCVQDLLNISTNIKIGELNMFGLLLLKVLNVRAAQWESYEFKDSGAQYLSNHILGLLSKMSHSEHEQLWQTHVGDIVSAYLSEYKSYSMSETETILCLIGGDFNSYSQGFIGKDDNGNKLIIAGFSQYWHNHEIPSNFDENLEVPKICPSIRLNSKDQLAIVVKVEDNFESSYSVSIEKLEDLKMSEQQISKSSNFKLNQERFEKLIHHAKIGEEINEEDILTLVRKCHTLKTFVSIIKHKGEQNFSDLSKEDKLKLFKYCLYENRYLKTGNIEHINQIVYQTKLNELKSYATEHPVAIKKNLETSKITFTFKYASNDENKVEKSFGVFQTFNGAQERTAIPFEVQKGLNHQLLWKEVPYALVYEPFVDTKDIDGGWGKNSALLIKGETLADEQSLENIIKGFDVFITTDVDLKKLFETLFVIDKSTICSKTFLVLSDDDFTSLASSLSEEKKEEDKVESDCSVQELFIKEIANHTKIPSRILSSIISNEQTPKLTDMTKKFLERTKDIEIPKEEEKVEEVSLKQPKVTKKTIHQINDYGTDFSFGLDAISGYNESLKSFCELKETPEVDPAKVKNIDWWKEVYDIDENTIEKEYIQTLKITSKFLAENIISEILKSDNLEDYLENIVEDEMYYSDFIYFLSTPKAKSIQKSYINLISKCIHPQIDNIKLGSLQKDIYSHVIISG